MTRPASQNHITLQETIETREASPPTWLCKMGVSMTNTGLACTQGFPKVLRKEGMLNTFKVGTLALCIFYSRQGAEDAKVPPRTLLLCSLYTLCTLARGLAGNCGGEDQPLKFPVFDGRRAVGQEYGENEAG